MTILLVAILDDPTKIWDVMDAWSKLGVRDATIFDSTGLHRAERLREDMPLFPSVADLLQSAETYHRTIWSLVPETVDLEAVVQATEAIVGSLHEPHAGLLFAVPVIKSWGLRQPGHE